MQVVFLEAQHLQKHHPLHMAAVVWRGPRERVMERRWVFGNLKMLPGSDNDLVALADQVAAASGPKPLLYQWCGTEDPLYADNLAFRDRAQKAGLDLTYEEGPGGHEWVHWDRMIQRVLEWMPLRRAAKNQVIREEHHDPQST